MPLTANTLPSQLPDRPVPYDTVTAFASNQTIAATGYINSVQTQIDLGPGRVDGYLVLDISTLKQSGGDEIYRIYLMGSNDVNWGAGNVDTIVIHDFSSATAGRLVPAICAATPAVPITGRSSTRYAFPFCNLVGGFLFRYTQLYVVMSGTGPTMTLSAWLSLDYI